MITKIDIKILNKQEGFYDLEIKLPLNLWLVFEKKYNYVVCDNDFNNLCKKELSHKDFLWTEINNEKESLLIKINGLINRYMSVNKIINIHNNKEEYFGLISSDNKTISELNNLKDDLNEEILSNLPINFLVNKKIKINEKQFHRDIFSELLEEEWFILKYKFDKQNIF